MLYVMVLLLAALIVLFFAARGETSLLSGFDGYELAALIGGTVLVTFYVFYLLPDYRGRLGQAARHILIWIGIAFAIIAGYAYRAEFSAVTERVMGELLPPGQGITIATGTTGERAVRIRRRADGHFNAVGDVNGASLTLLIDTGASTVVLRPADAERAGIDTASLSYTVPVETANGTAYAAPIRLRSITIGPIEIQGVDALVAKPGALNQSLLGMSFLTRLRSYEFSGDFLTLRS